MNHPEKSGASVILCCHNSAARIRETLFALSLQKTGGAVNWEVILVNNASTDNTAEFAENCWKEFGNITNLRIVLENKPGLAHARNRGIRESFYSILVFCDDDNRLHPLYILNAVTYMESDPSLAACGGCGRAVFEDSIQPEWFSDYQEAYAIGPQDKAMENGKILSLYGAGLIVRKQCIEDLYHYGFKPVMTGRKGKALSSSEDTELTNAFVLAGYTLGYAAEMEFDHLLPKERLSKAYLKKLFIAFGTDGPIRNLYYSAITERWVHRQFRFWSVHFLFSIFRLVKYAVLPPKKNGRLIYYHWNIAYIKQLLRLQSNYTSLCNNIFTLKNKAAVTPEVEQIQVQTLRKVKLSV